MAVTKLFVAICVLILTIYLLIISLMMNQDSNNVNESEKNMSFGSLPILRKWAIENITLDQNYDSSRAMLNRVNIMKNVCNEYRDILNVEYSIGNHGNSTEIQRLYSNNLSLTFCSTELGKNSRRVHEWFQEFIKNMAESSLDILEPCEAKKIYDSTTLPPKKEYVEHPEYPGVYINRNPVRKTVCNTTYELLNLNFKVLLVQNPVQRLISAFKCQDEAANFHQFVHKLVDMNQESDLEKFRCKDMILHQWQRCAICKEEVKPNFIIKLEHFQQDLEQLLKKFNSQPEFFKDKVIPQRPILEIENENLALWINQLPLSMRINIFNMYRNDFELFGYSPSDILGDLDAYSTTI